MYQTACFMLMISRWHQDIHPKNFLVRNNHNTNSPYDYSFLFADLGLCHFKKIIGQQRAPSDKDYFGTYIYGLSSSSPNIPKFSFIS